MSVFCLIVHIITADYKSLCEASNCYIINSNFYVEYFFVKKLLFMIKKKRKTY